MSIDTLVVIHSIANGDFLPLVIVVLTAVLIISWAIEKRQGK